MQKAGAISNSTQNLASFLAGCTGCGIPDTVVEKAKHHIVDTFAAMISGIKLDVGVRALAAASAFEGRPEASVVGHREGLPAYAAAMINAMLAHADETDDSHEMAKFHPGCSIVPTAWAIAQPDGRSGLDVIRSVAAGYDVGARILEAIGPMVMHHSGHSTHACGSLFGAGAAASILMGFDEVHARRLISYLVHELSGLVCWLEDRDHVQKAYVFGGMSAKNAVMAAVLVRCGWTGIDDAMVGANRLFEVHGRSNGQGLDAPFALGEEILRSNIKKWCVGSPIQAALDSLEALSLEAPVDVHGIDRVTIELPSFEAPVVDNRDMPNINLQHLAAVFLIEGELSFEAAHDLERFENPKIKALRDKIQLVASEALQDEGGRQAIVTLHDVSGGVRQRRTRHVRGTWGNPMPRSEVDAKARDLIGPVLGSERTSHLLSSLWRLEQINREDVATLIKSIAPL
jgi:2-methylcitrate dehydratase PrpD